MESDINMFHQTVRALMENKSLEQRMETEPVHRVILSLAAPTVLSMLVISAYSIVDTFFVTRLGSRATGAVGITFALVAWIQAVGYTVGMGAGSLVSRLLGKKEKEQAEQIANSAIMSGLLLGLISLGAGLIFLTPLLKLSGATTELLPYAREYALFVLLSAPFTIETLVLGTLLRAQGRAKASMAGMVTGGILDIILTPVFLFVLNLGVKGAALAAFIGQTVAAMVLGGCFWHGRLKLNGKKQSKNFFKIKDYGSIIKNGLPSLCRQGFASVAAVLLNRQAVGYGDAAVAAMSVDGRLFMVFFSLFIGYGQGFQPVAGYQFGAENKKKLKQAFIFTLWSSIIAAAGIGLAGFLFAPMTMSFFLKEDMAARIGIFTFRSQCLILSLIPIGILSNMLFQGIGQQGKAAFLSACRQGIVFLPLIFLLPEWIGLAGVEIAQALSDGLTAIISIPFVFCYFQKSEKKRTKKKTSDGKRRL